jgi:hypothetical protein
MPAPSSSAMPMVSLSPKNHVVDGANMARVVLADHFTYDSRSIWGLPEKELDKRLNM